MAVEVLVEIKRMATGAGGASDDVGVCIGWRGQGRRRGVTVGAAALVHGYRAVGGMADRDAGRGVEENAVVGSREVDCRRRFIHVA